MTLCCSDLLKNVMLDSPKVEKYSWRIQHECSLKSKESTQLRNDLAIAFCQDKLLLPFISVTFSQMKLDSAKNHNGPNLLLLPLHVGNVKLSNTSKSIVYQYKLMKSDY